MVCCMDQKTKNFLNHILFDSNWNCANTIHMSVTQVYNKSVRNLYVHIRASEKQTIDLSSSSTHSTTEVHQFRVHLVNVV